jgi:hypothetical protein
MFNFTYVLAYEWGTDSVIYFLFQSGAYNDG